MSDTLSILYIDDEPDIRLIVEMSLRMRPGIEVRTAPSGEDGLDLLASSGWRPDLVMVDMMMPGMTGTDVLAAIRADPTTSGIPVIIVTARARPQDVEGYIGQGAKAVITKPFDPLKLADQVIALLQ